MRSQPSVVAQYRSEPALEIHSEQRRPRPKATEPLECPEEPFDDGDGAGSADGAVPVADAVSGEAILESLRGELGAPIGHRVAGSAEAPGRGGEEAADVGGAWLGAEDPRGERATREHVERDGYLEGEEAEKAGDLRDVEHPDVVGEAGADTAALGGRPWCLGWGSHRLLPADALDGPAREPPADVCERGGDRGVAREPGQCQRLDDVADIVGEAADGRIRLEIP